jgi:hypothetical protein
MEPVFPTRSTTGERDQMRRQEAALERRETLTADMKNKISAIIRDHFTVSLRDGGSPVRFDVNTKP